MPESMHGEWGGGGSGKNMGGGAGQGVPQKICVNGGVRE